MAIHMEGEITFEWQDGNIIVSDDADQRIYVSLRQFFGALSSAQQLAATICASQSCNIVSIVPGAMLARGGPL